MIDLWKVGSLIVWNATRFEVCELGICLTCRPYLN